jgi:hypothetical protein
MKQAAAVPEAEARILELGGVVIAWLESNSPVASWGWARARTPRSSVWLEGELVPREEEARDPSAVVRSACERLVSAETREELDRRLNELWGPFTGVACMADGTVSVFIDRFGVRRLYHYREGENWTAFSQLAMARALQQRTLDEESYIDCLRIGTPLGEKTIVRGLRRLLPGHRLEVGAERQRKERWLQIPESRSPRRQSARAFERLLDAHSGCARRFIRVGGESAAIALTGGNDSRAIYASMISQGGKPFAVTFGLHGGYQIPDVVIAQKTARAVGQSWRTVDRTAYDGPGAPSDTDMLFLTDGSFASRMLAAVGLSARAGSDWIAIGLGADYLVGRTGGDVDPRKHRDVDGIARQLHREFSREWPTAEQLRDMASLDHTHDEEEHLARWLKTWQEFTDLPPAEAYARHQMCYRQVGKLSPRLDSVRVFATPCYPYMCPDVFKAYLSLPDRLWAKGYAHILVPEKLAPPLRRVQARKLWPLPIPPRWEASARPLKNLGRMVQRTFLHPIQGRLKGTTGTTSWPDDRAKLLLESPRLNSKAVQAQLDSWAALPFGRSTFDGACFLEWLVRTVVTGEPTPGFEGAKILSSCLPDLEFVAAED